ncbi:MAG: hypothetical protein JWN95_2309 [Frankiales bacterium]|nr:hypothetical protein [Frankiales bacterium]
MTDNQYDEPRNVSGTGPVSEPSATGWADGTADTTVASDESTGESIGTKVPPTRPAPGFDHKGHVRSTRSSGLWIGLIGTAVFVILLVIFIAQNSRNATLHFFGWSGQFSLALTILLSAVIGILLVAIPGSIRILQLRRALRKNVPSELR